MIELIIIAVLYVLGAVLMRELAVICNKYSRAQIATLCAFWPIIAAGVLLARACNIIKGDKNG